MGKTETHFGSIYFVVFSTDKKLIYWSRLTSKCSSWQCLNFLKSTTREGFYTGIISNTRLVECKLNCFLYAGAGIFPLNYRSDTRHLNISQPIRNLNILLLCVVSAKGISVKLKRIFSEICLPFPLLRAFLPPPTPLFFAPAKQAKIYLRHLSTTKSTNWNQILKDKNGFIDCILTGTDK